MRKDRKDLAKKIIKANRKKLSDRLYEEIIEHLSSASFSYTVRFFPARVFYNEKHRTEFERLAVFLGVYRNIRWSSKNFVEVDLDANQIASLIRQEYVTRIRSRA